MKSARCVAAAAPCIPPRCAFLWAPGHWQLIAEAVASLLDASPCNQKLSCFYYTSSQLVKLLGCLQVGVVVLLIILQHSRGASRFFKEHSKGTLLKYENIFISKVRWPLGRRKKRLHRWPMGRKNITPAIMLIREPVPLSAFKETNKSDHIKQSLV